MPQPTALSIQFQPATGQLVYVTDDQHRWNVQREPPDKSWRTKQIWPRMRDLWTDRTRLSENLQSVGARLGAWLCDDQASNYLRKRATEVRAGTLLSIALYMPWELADWPWELSSLPGLGPLAVHEAFGFARFWSPLSTVGAQPIVPDVEVGPLELLCMDAVAVQLDSAPDYYPSLATGTEVQLVDQVIRESATAGRFAVSVDPLGHWSALIHRYSQDAAGKGPPHIFHFAGHGLANGAGLVFRSEKGKPEEVDAQRIAHLLTGGGAKRRTRLVFLNACATAGTQSNSKPQLQPFGGLAQQLVEHGVPLVIGVQSPLRDSEAQRLARTFYQALGSGLSVDAAVQRARKELYLHNPSSTAWGFLSLNVAAGAASGQPLLLSAVTAAASSVADPTAIISFGYGPQRTRLAQLIHRTDPTVVIVPGERGTGHRLMTQSVQDELVRAGRVLWRPVAVMRWLIVGDPELSRSLLLAAIAEALTLPSTGDEAALESRLAQAIAERCGGDCVLVIDLEKPVGLASDAEAAALLELVQELFVRLMAAAKRQRTSLPVFLLLPVEWPRKLSPEDRRAERSSKQLERTRATIAALRKKRLEGPLRLEVLPEIEQFTEEMVAEFLETVRSLSPERAAQIAQQVVGDDNDNERIVSLLIRYLSQRGL